ncbi:Uncharacterised protein [Edwardsiella tarda]|uniref:Uncharacterized protein n=1 Tax=Edwardsiella tarda ATCC 15947 = NBRC 105688 TaxID=667121 RepID=A0AC61TM02_EDWTA|nr:hypothetical protein [Edwardsiella tarda]UAL55316.1 hypothetical protein K8O98_10725 [Edwardsiella tarda]UCQ01641.1 hypothetical protein DCL27_07780 [Edwardsiella tarda ATCC 15947 = NBRC 105688]STD29349.1 Uncharacterised protein [Edwardsiella tarda]
MEKQEPKVIAGNMSNEELFAWMKQKAKAADDLRSALDHKIFLEQQLQITVENINRLTQQASVNIL